MREIIIEDNEAKQRLDRFLYKYLDKAPKSLIQKYIRKKKVKVNDKRAYPDYILKKGDLIKLYIYDETIYKYRSRKEFKILDESLDYIYEDDNIAIINKAPNIIMYGGDSPSLVDVFISDMIKKEEFIVDNELIFTPSFANRLDRNTAGILIGCKNSESLRIINKLFKERKIEKGYRTMVNGQLLEETRVDESIKEVANNRVEVRPDGKESLSIFRPIKLGDNYSLIDANLVSGRKHQLRVHLAHIGHPILGDSKYGKGEKLESFGVVGQYLISYKIIFKNVPGKLSYLTGQEFDLDPSYYNKDLEDYYLNI